MSTKEGGVGWREAEAPPPETESIVWSEDAGRFQTPDGEAFLEYVFKRRGDERRTTIRVWRELGWRYKK